ncbi:HlyD family secretion protein [Hydrogenimonas sp.]
MERIKRYWPVLAALALAAVAAWMIVLKLHPRQLPPNLVMGVGRVDGDLVRLNVKYPGRLAEQRAKEGMAVRRGEVLARQRSEEFEARLARLEAAVAAKSKELAAKRVDLDIAKKTIPLALTRAGAQIESARAAIAGLSRRIEAQRSVVAQDERDERRTRNLYEKRLIQKEALEKARLKLEVDRRTLQGLEAQMKEAESALKAAQADRAQAEAKQRSLEALEKSVAALAEGLKAAEAARDEAKAAVADLTILSPLDGFVVEKIAETGEVLGAGMPVATLIDPASLYLKIYVDTIENGKIAVGDKAVIFLDAAPDNPIPARVTRIAQRAEFTPKEVNVRSDRIQRVFAVHLTPLKPDPRLKLGIPATGVVSCDGKGLPDSLNDLPEL